MAQRLHLVCHIAVAADTGVGSVALHHTGGFGDGGGVFVGVYMVFADLIHKAGVKFSGPGGHGQQSDDEDQCQDQG